MPFALAGFADLSSTRGSKLRRLDLVTQPQLLVDVRSFAGRPGRFWAGTEWNVHLNPVKDAQALQAMLQWTLR